MTTQDWFIKIAWLLAALSMAADDRRYIQVGTYTVDLGKVIPELVTSEEQCKLQCVSRGTAMYGIQMQERNEYIKYCLCVDEIPKNDDKESFDTITSNIDYSSLEANVSFYHREDFSHVGCFRLDNVDDQWSQFDSWQELNDSYYEIDRDFCLAQCSIDDFIYSSLLNGKRCLCFNHFTDLNDRLPAEQCNNTCIANDRQTCGGENKLQIFQKSLHLICENSMNTFIPVPMVQCLLAGNHRGSLAEYALKGQEKLCNADDDTTQNAYEKPVVSDQECGSIETENVEFGRRATKYNKAYVYLGCFMQNTSFQLPWLINPKDDLKASFNSMNGADCISYCSRNGLPYAGMTEGISCFCGETILSSEMVTTPNRCNMTCSRNPDLENTCGGHDAMDIYFIKNHVLPVSERDDDLANSA